LVKLLFIAAESSSKDIQEKPAEPTEKHDELFDAIASLFPDKGLMGAEVHRRLVYMKLCPSLLTLLSCNSEATGCY